MAHTWARVVEVAGEPEREARFLELEGKIVGLDKASRGVVMRLSLIGHRERFDQEFSLKIFSKKIQRQLLKGGVAALRGRNWFHILREVDEGKIYLRANRHRASSLWR